MDLEKFFDRVNHEVLMGLLHQRFTDPRLLTLIRRYRQAGIRAEGVVTDRHEGTPQGGPLSPLLANVLLDVVDKQLEQRAHRFVRGYSFWHAKGGHVKRRVSPKALSKLKARIREITSRNGGRSPSVAHAHRQTV